jgi:hypothetical protein
MAVRNFQAVPWLRQLIVAENVVKVFGTQSIPAFDFGSVSALSFDDNDIDGQGVASAGVIVRKPCEGSIGRNVIRNLGPGGQAIVNADGANVRIAADQG